MMLRWFLSTNNGFLLTFYSLVWSSLEISRNSQGSYCDLWLFKLSVPKYKQSPSQSTGKSSMRLAKQDKPATIQRINHNLKQIHVSGEKMRANQLQELFHLARIHRKNMTEQTNANPWSIRMPEKFLLHLACHFCGSVPEIHFGIPLGILLLKNLEWTRKNSFVRKMLNEWSIFMCIRSIHWQRKTLHGKFPTVVFFHYMKSVVMPINICMSEIS